MDLTESMLKPQMNKKSRMEGREQPEKGDEAGAPGHDMRSEENETKKLLRIFPTEIWNKILDNITDPPTLRTLSDKFELFNELLEPRKTTYLFPDVWVVLDSYFHQNAPSHIDVDKLVDSEPTPAVTLDQPRQPNDNDGNNAIIDRQNEAGNVADREIDDNENQNPTIQVDEGLSECGNCYKWIKNWWVTQSVDLRRVCSTWKRGIDHAHQEPRFLQVWEPSPMQDKCTIKGRGLEIHVEDDEGIANFLTHFRETHQDTDSPPIITRHITLWMKSSGEFPHELTAFLATYGPRFWYCELNIFHVENVDNLCVNVNTVLLNMPNLRQLTLNGDAHNPLYVGSGTKIVPFAHLPVLDSLLFNELPDALTTRITLANPQVKHLSLANHQPISNKFVNALRKLNPETVDLQLRSFHDVAKLSSASASWKIRSAKVSVCTNSGYNPVFVRYVDVFRFLENWRETLTIAEIELGRAQSEYQRLSVVMDTSLHALNLPKVEYLSCDLSNMGSLDFLLGTAPSLKTLSVTMDCKNYGKIPWTKRWEEVPGKVIDVNPTDQAQDISKSNLWDHFPVLGKFDYRVYKPSPNQPDTKYVYERREFYRKKR